MAPRPGRSRKDFAAEPEPAPSSPLLEQITRFWVSVVIVAAILYAAILAISRTDGFNGLVRQRIESLLDIPVSIEAVRITPSLDLAVEGLSEAGATNRPPRIRIDHARADWRFTSLFSRRNWPFNSLDIDGCTIEFSGGEKERGPVLKSLGEALAPWAHIRDETPAGEAPAAAPFMLTEYLRGVHARIAIRDLELIWSGAPGEPPQTRAEGVSFEAEPVRAIDETVLWCRLEAARVTEQGAVRLENFSAEWIRMHDRDVILRSGAGP